MGAQGLVHLGKGTLTLNPFHSDRQLMSPVAVAGLMSVLVAMLDVKTTILGKSHYLLYGLATAMQPRMFVTRLGEPKKELWGNALTTMTTLIRASTTSMTIASVSESGQRCR